jgi:hypothetical protein
VKDDFLARRFCVHSKGQFLIKKAMS